MSLLPKNLFTPTGYLATVSLKSLVTASVFSIMNKYFNSPMAIKDKTFYLGFIGSFMSSATAELIMTSILQRLLKGNAGLKRIFDQGLNAVISGGLNKYAYKVLVKDAPVDGRVFQKHEEFILQIVADAIGEVMSYYYLVPLLGLDAPSVQAVYG